MTGRLNLLWPALIAIVFTLVLVEWSFDRFRLAGEPFIDDVSWLYDGMVMRETMHSGGFRGLARYVRANPTLFPYSVVAAVGFTIFQAADWAPYVMNAWLVFSLLLFLQMARRRARLPAWTWLAAAATALAFPINGYSIVLFVGDFASGLFMAVGSVALLENWPASESTPESWVGPLAWVFAFYAKPNFFPETLLLFLATAIAGYSLARREVTGDRSGGLERRWGLRVVAVLAAILPYYSVVGPAVYRYLYSDNFGALRQIFAFRGSRLEGLTWYLTGFSGEMMLGPALYLAVGLVTVRIPLLLSANGTERLRFAALMLVVFLAFALPTWSDVKGWGTAAAFQFLVVLVSAISLLEIVKRFPRQAKKLASLSSVAALLLFQLPKALDARESAAVKARHRTIQGLVSAMREANVGRTDSVFLTTIGYVSAASLRYQFVKRRLPVPRFFDLGLSNNPSEFPPMIAQAGFVIASDAGNDDVFYTAPSAFVQGETLGLVRSNPDFIEMARFSTWRGKHFYLFGRRGRVRETSVLTESESASPGPRPIRGLSAPLPDGQRWAGREFEIEFPAPRGLFAELQLHIAIPPESFGQTGVVALRADIPREGAHIETWREAGVHVFRYRYYIKNHLVSTVPVHFRLDKERAALVSGAELEPVTDLDPPANR